LITHNDFSVQPDLVSSYVVGEQGRLNPELQVSLGDASIGSLMRYLDRSEASSGPWSRHEMTELLPP
jgi:hypothetical protein